MLNLALTIYVNKNNIQRYIPHVSSSNPFSLIFNVFFQQNPALFRLFLLSPAGPWFVARSAPAQCPPARRCRRASQRRPACRWTNDPRQRRTWPRSHQGTFRVTPREPLWKTPMAPGYQGLWLRLSVEMWKTPMVFAGKMICNTCMVGVFHMELF